MKSVWPALAFLALSSTGAVAQDISAGERSWNKCRACHQVGETAKNGVGPQLNGLFGRHSGAVDGYSYSAANRNSGITWDDAIFADYIKDPRAKIPGTKMVFAGIKNEQEIRDLTAFLKQFATDGKKGS
ncbi:cytochrome c family protein [Bosea sp. 124]|uniref:c-type cytochrome n=1 Tax=Bosea sp. 124 TaxID=2135642 RepID=UPI000D38A696|nr:cytochrome c family protein [Bosea sp. 124]PTM39406.1 cytochrome c [Bosea sp. 124]